jgi:hypothetical protein
VATNNTFLVKMECSYFDVTMEDILLYLYWSNLKKVILILLYKLTQNKLLFYYYSYCKSQNDSS